MKKILSPRKILIFLIVLLLIIYLIHYGSLGYFYTNPGSNTVFYKASESDISSFSMYIGGILLVSFGLYSFIKRKTGLTVYGLCVFLLFIIMFLFGLGSIIAYGLVEVLRMPITPFVYMLFVGVFCFFDKNVSNLVKRISLPFGSVCIIASFIYIMWFKMRYGGVISNSPQIIYLSTGFWPFAFGILVDEKHSLIKKVYVFLVLGLIMLTAAIYGTRGWLIQGFLLTMLYIIRITKRSFWSLFKIFIVFISAGVMAFFIFYHYFSSYFEYLFNRVFADSRSWQYIEIFSQSSFFDLLFGKGMFGTYESSFYGTYSYIDNGFVQMMFFFGVFPLLLYIFILVYPMFRCFKYKVRFRKKMVGFVLLLWIFAVGGLSVYNVAIMDIRLFYIIFTCAYCLNKSNFVPQKGLYENYLCCR